MENVICRLLCGSWKVDINLLFAYSVIISWELFHCFLWPLEGGDWFNISPAFLLMYPQSCPPDVWCLLSSFCCVFKLIKAKSHFPSHFIPFFDPCSSPPHVTVGLASSIMTSRASSSFWRGESTPTGRPTAVPCPTTLNASCPFVQSTALWVPEEARRAEMRKRTVGVTELERMKGNEWQKGENEPHSQWLRQLKNRNETTQWQMSAHTAFLAHRPDSNSLLHLFLSLTRAAVWWSLRRSTSWAATPSCATTTPPCKLWAGWSLRWAPCTSSVERKSVLHPNTFWFTLTDFFSFSRHFRWL